MAESSRATVPRRPSYASVVGGASARPAFMSRNTAAVASNSQLTQAIDQGRPVNDDPGYTSHRRGLSTTSSSHRRASSHAPSHYYPPFWVPAYLEGTRFARKVRTSWVARRKAIHEASITSRDDKIVPGDGGMAYKVIESKSSSLEDDLLLPLPSMWNIHDKHSTLEILGPGTEIRYSANGPSTTPQLESATVRADYPMPPQCGIYYYEIKIRSKPKECSIAIGFAQRSFSLERLPGWEANSWAFHSDDGRAFIGSQNGQQYHKAFGENDVIGCGVDFNKNQVFFTRNGQDLGVAFKDLLSPADAIYPCVGVRKHSTVQISTNFGQQEFLFDIRARMEKSENEVRQQILNTDTSVLHPGQTGTAFTQELVAQYLSHAGFIETARAFAEQVQRERETLYGETSSLPDLQNPETNDARPRQQIRSAIQKGDIDSALSLIDANFPTVLTQSPQIPFRLKCCKFLELLKKATTSERSQRKSASNPKRSSNGISSNHASTSNNEDVAMDLDDNDNNNSDNINSATTPPQPSPDPEQDSLDLAFITYGRTLHTEYNPIPEFAKPLAEIQSLTAYWNPPLSPHGDLLDVANRLRLAEDVNSTILEILGRSPTAALERAVKQTEALVEVLSKDGGAGSMVRIRLNRDD